MYEYTSWPNSGLGAALLGLDGLIVGGVQGFVRGRGEVAQGKLTLAVGVVDLEGVALMRPFAADRAGLPVLVGLATVTQAVLAALGLN
jgi:hypothetical protein